MISSRLITEIGLKEAASAPTTASLRMRAAMLGIAPGASCKADPEAEAEATAMAGLAPAVEAGDSEAFGGEEFWPDMPDPVEEAAEEEAAEAPPEQPAPASALALGQRLVMLRPGGQRHAPAQEPPASQGLGASSKSGAPRPPAPLAAAEAKAPPAKAPAKAKAEGAQPLKDWELQRERKRQAATLRDTGCKAICAIKHGLRQPGAQEDGRAFVPEDWDTEFKPLLGSYIKFLLSRPDQFRVVEGTGPGLFTIENVAGNTTVVAPEWGSWKKDWKKVKSEVKEEVKEEYPRQSGGWGNERWGKGGWQRGNANGAGGRPWENDRWTQPKIENGGGWGGWRERDGKGSGSSSWGGWRGSGGKDDSGSWGKGWPKGGGAKGQAGLQEVKIEPSAWGEGRQQGWRRAGPGASGAQGSAAAALPWGGRPEPDVPRNVPWAAELSRSLPPLRPMRNVPPGLQPQEAPGNLGAQAGGPGPAEAEEARLAEEEFQLEDELAGVEPLPFVVEGDDSATVELEQSAAATAGCGFDVWDLLSGQKRPAPPAGPPPMSLWKRPRW